eukprot:610142-Pleurochrysis_carterae.AAC.1
MLLLRRSAFWSLTGLRSRLWRWRTRRRRARRLSGCMQSLLDLSGTRAAVRDKSVGHLVESGRAV